MSRLTILSDVVLPQPDGPTRTQILPAGTMHREVVDGAGGRLAGGLAGRRVVALGDVVELDDRGLVAGLGHRPGAPPPSGWLRHGRRSADSTASPRPPERPGRRYSAEHAHHGHPPRPPDRPARPAVPRGLGSGAADLVRGDRRPRRDGRRRGRRRIRRHDGRVRGVRAPVPRPGPAGDRPSRPGARDDRLPRRPVLAARGGALGHRGPGRRAARGDVLRRRHGRDPGLCVVRDAPAARRAGRERPPPPRGRLPGDEDPDRPAAAGRGPRRRSRRRARPSATRWP